MHPEDLDFETRAPRCPRYQELRPDNHGDPELLYQKIHNIKKPDLRPDTSREQDIFGKNTRSIKPLKHEDSDPSRNQELRPYQLGIKISQPDRPEASELRNLKIQTPQEIKNFDQIYQTSVPNTPELRPDTWGRQTRHIRETRPTDKIHQEGSGTQTPELRPDTLDRQTRYTKMIWNPDTRSPDIGQTHKTHQEASGTQTPDPQTLDRQTRHIKMIWNPDTRFPEHWIPRL
ncbi:hypothetical protein BKA70DRAFT_1468263 [Coprinopsis sp. MPI-PUGE-AT-0042]|nr:hypothetical protein BKA70DRAFT_1468263 [Coprinopsis sp. MPI-PUGE-AT-0042]